MGAHGTLEWLPGKAVALTAECFPEIVTGALPVIYPFIVSNPGEAAQAKRRIAGADDRPSAAAARRRRAERRRARARASARRICPGRRPRSPPPRAARRADRRNRAAHRIGARGWNSAGVDGAVAPDEALRRIDAWLCDLKDLAIKDGQHIYGRAPAGADDPAWRGERRGRTRGACSPRSTAPRRAGTGRRAGARPARRAADRPQSLHRRSAHAADADRDGARPPRRR